MNNKTGFDYICDHGAVGFSPAMLDVYCHATQYIQTVDALEADNVCEGVAHVIADAGYVYAMRAP